MELESMEKDEKILALETRLADYREEALKNDENVQRLSKLYELGIINERVNLLKKISYLFFKSSSTICRNIFSSYENLVNCSEHDFIFCLMGK